MSYQDPITVSGSLVTFNDPDGDGRITNLSAAISPNQDLNGYDHPWPGGGGKNIADVRTDNSSNSQRISITGTPGNLTFTSTGSYGRVGYIVPVVTGQTYTISFKASKTVSSGANSTLYVNDTVGNWNYSYGAMFISKEVSSEREYTKTITATSDTLFLGFYLSVANSYPDTVIVKDFQVELGSSKTSYAPYSNICPISGRTGAHVYVSPTSDVADATTYTEDWTSEAGTVYGGTIDVVTGVLTVNKMMFSANTSTMDNAEDFPGWKSSGVKANNPVSGAQANALTNVGKGCSINTNGSNDIIFLPKTYYNGMTQSEWIALAQDVQIVYELATPITYQLTPQEVEALLGTNNIWADAGDVTVTYQLARHGFEGWLIKVGTEQTEIPLNFIRYSTYKVTPDQRMEWSAERNVNGVLQRETVPNMPPKIEFNTKLLTNSDVTALMSILNKSFTVASERKLPVYFYDPENNTYKTWDCYMPDIDFKIRNVDTVKNIINYEELRFAFIGY